MKTLESTVTWTDGMAFRAALNGHTFTIDGDGAVGGRDLGPRPKGLLLTALAGCTAMDVISILRKMRVDLRSFSVQSSGTVTDEHPKRFVRVTRTYTVEGDESQRPCGRAESGPAAHRVAPSPPPPPAGRGAKSRLRAPPGGPRSHGEATTGGCRSA